MAIISQKKAWLLLAVMWVAYFLNYSDRQVIFSIFPKLQSELNLSDVQLGLTSSIFIIVYGICSPIAGHLADRYSKRMLIVISLVFWSGITTLTGFAQSAWMLLLCRALIGVTESLFNPPAMALTANSHPPAIRSTAIALFDTAQLGGTVMGGWYGGFMAEAFHWRWAFFSLGLIGILYAFPYMKVLLSMPEDSYVETKKSQNLFAGTTLVRVPSFRYLCLTFPSFTLLLWTFYTWFPSYLYKKFSLSLAEAGFTATVYLQAATLVGLIVGGIMADRIYSLTKASRFWLLATGMLIAGPSAHFIGSSNSLFATKISALCFGLGSGLFIGNLFVSAFEVIPSNTRASAVGLINLIGALVSSTGVLMVGMFRRTVGMDTMLTIAALACTVAGLILIYGVKRHFRHDYELVH